MPEQSADIGFALHLDMQAAVDPVSHIPHTAVKAPRQQLLASPESGRRRAVPLPAAHSLPYYSNVYRTIQQNKVIKRFHRVQSRYIQ